MQYSDKLDKREMATFDDITTRARRAIQVCGDLGMTNFKTITEDVFSIQVAWEIYKRTLWHRIP